MIKEWPLRKIGDNNKKTQMAFIKDTKELKVHYLILRLPIYFQY